MSASPPSRTSRAVRFFVSLGAMFRPPFEGLWLIVLLYYAWCFVVANSQTVRGNFPDPDDYMYAVQIMDWLKGAAWYDNIQHRINPPDGILIHFSRIAMIPMAALVLLFEKIFGLGPRGGTMLMALVYPLILLGGFLVTLRRIAACFVPENWAGITSYIALFAIALMYMFQPYHIDHHGLIIWIIAIALLCSIRMIEQPYAPKYAIGSGLAIALGQVLALEILPWLLLISGWLGFWAVIRGKQAARSALVYALTLHIASIFFLLVTRPPAAFFTEDVLTYSVVYVYLTGGIAVSFAAAALFAETGIALRLIITASFAALSGFLFLHTFPALIGGPYAAMDPELQDLILEGVSEAMPLVQKFHDHFLLCAYLSATALALFANAWFVWRADAIKRWTWGLQFVLLVAGFLLTTFYQCRYGGTMEMLTVVPLAAFFYQSWQWIEERLKDRGRIYAEFGLILLVGPLLNVFLPALQDGRSFSHGILLFPANGNEDNPCDMYVLEQALRDPAGLGDRPRLLLNEMGQGPELLYRTSHSVLAAPFFDTNGDTDAYRFFSTPYAEEAKAIAFRRHVDLIVSCKLIPAAYMRETISQPDNAIKRDFAPHLIERLIANRGVPSWLHRVEIPHLNNYVIYEVIRPEAKDGADIGKLSDRP